MTPPVDKKRLGRQDFEALFCLCLLWPGWLCRNGQEQETNQVDNHAWQHQRHRAKRSRRHRCLSQNSPRFHCQPDFRAPVSKATLVQIDSQADWLRLQSKRFAALAPLPGCVPLTSINPGWLAVARTPGLYSSHASGVQKKCSENER